MLTHLALMSLYKSPTIPLSEICEELFALSYEEALKKAARNELPVPTFKLGDSRRAPLMVSAEDLGTWIDSLEADGMADRKAQLQGLNAMEIRQRAEENIVGIITQLLSATEARAAPGVYFLIDAKGTVIYVGQSQNVLARLSGHADKPFYQARMIPVPSQGKRMQVEARFIRLLRPALNIRGLGESDELKERSAS